MNVDRVAGVRFAGYGEYLQAKQLAERLSAINPKLPVQLVLTSWYPQAGKEELPGPEHLDGGEPVYADVKCDSPSRLEHFIEMLAQLRSQTRQLNHQLSQASNLSAAPVAEVSDDATWLTEYFSPDT